MNFAFHDLARAVAGKDSISDCNAYELKQLISQYPYFGPAHLLLAKKLKQEEMLTTEQQYQKTILYFQDPVWLDYLLKDSLTDSAQELEPELISTPEYEPIHAEQEIPVTNEEVVVQTSRSFDIVNNDGNEFADQDSVLDIEPKIAPLRMEFKEMNTTTELSFEPYHTVDYFASQGIQAKDEEKPKDRFAIQLKSFTEWLKTMKRVPANEVAAAVNPNEEKKVAQMAEKSITDREVLTEAMAEVWEKQGNHQRALETYKKLSLLDPSKSSYFAAKIEQLKHS